MNRIKYGPAFGPKHGSQLMGRPTVTNTYHHGSVFFVVFTQVRAASRHKTLLLLWWIDGGKLLVVRSTLAQQGLLRGSRDYAHMGVRVV